MIKKELEDWFESQVEDAVNEATEYHWGELACWVEAGDDGSLVFLAAGPEKPELNHQGLVDIYTKRWKILDQLNCFVDPYTNIGGAKSEEQRQDVRERRAALEGLANAIMKMLEN